LIGFDLNGERGFEWRIELHKRELQDASRFDRALGHSAPIQHRRLLARSGTAGCFKKMTLCIFWPAR
jgi:hypothetical protein